MAPDNQEKHVRMLLHLSITDDLNLDIGEATGTAAAGKDVVVFPVIFCFPFASRYGITPSEPW